MEIKIASDYDGLTHQEGVFDDFVCDVSERQRIKFEIEGTAVVQQEGRRVFFFVI